MTTEIATIEDHARRAWSPAETELLDGWILAASGGFSRRLNSVAPLGPPDGLDDRIARCQRWYEERGLPLRFRLTPLIAADVDPHLAAAGFGLEAPTLVMRASLADVPEVPGSTIDGSPVDDWLQVQLDAAGIPRSDAAHWLEVLDRVPAPAGFALVMVEGRPAAAGLGVMSGDWLGVFEVVVATSFRGRGIGRRLMNTLTGWARSEGASRAYLQVMEDNRAAIDLYRRLGFLTAYPYWYRTEGFDDGMQDEIQGRVAGLTKAQSEPSRESE